MKPRDLQTLIADGETEETISGALADLKQLKPVTTEITDLRRELEAELATIQQSGRLL